MWPNELHVPSRKVLTVNSVMVEGQDLTWANDPQIVSLRTQLEEDFT